MTMATASTAETLPSTALNPIEPVFVIGCQRSGSTMLGAMLGGDPAVATIPEAQFVADLAPPGGEAGVHDMARIVEKVKAHDRFRIWRYDPGSDMPEGEASFGDAIRWVVRRYAADHARPDARLWVDHQPGHVRFIAKLNSHFPKLKAVHIIRDGRAVAASIMPLDWGPNTINRAAYFWLSRIGYGLAAQQYLGPDRCIMVRYEDILDAPGREMRKLADFLEIPYSDNLLTGEAFNVPQFTEKQHSLVGKGVKADQKEAWRAKLTKREIEIFEAIAADMLAYLGYEPISGPNPRPMSQKESIHLDLSNLMLKYKNMAAFARKMRSHVR